MVINKNRTKFEASNPQYSKRFAVSFDVMISLVILAVTMLMIMMLLVNDSHILLQAI